MAKSKKKDNKVYIVVVVLFACSIVALIVQLVFLVSYKVQLSSANKKYEEIEITTNEYRDQLSEIQAQIDAQ